MFISSVGTQMGRPSNCSAQQQDNGDDSTHPSDMYRQVQLGGDIPVKGLQRPGPNKPQSMYSIVIYFSRRL